ncbi:hypothetical protein LTR62_006039 [Meristemomyces frigidus]|uniref:Peptidase S54 rhomboid domain-containing protein n=1 Tax=Meristemomyces frigidus TaxID=1508187 RepID=A0AAN7TCV9_9PEZI|nr:hypothetical protein LTR62_006039 [Meristemomyces frigidus]
MNNAWTTIALRAPCARQQKARPLLELFSGYARLRRSFQSTIQVPSTICPELKLSRGVWEWQGSRRHVQGRSSFSTTATDNASKLRPPPPAKFDPNAARKKKEREALAGLEQERSKSPSVSLGPAPTVASYTEGVIPEEEEGGPITWRDYDPEGGMPLPQGELPQSEIDTVFDSKGVEADTGNYILSLLNWRRQSGALIDNGIDFPKGSGVSREQALRALQYIRNLDPDYDEQAAGERWAEEESQRLQEEIQARARSLGLYKQEKEPEYYEGEELNQGTPEGREATGTSVLRTHREEREAVHKAEEAEREAQALRDELASQHSQRGPLELLGGVQPTLALTTLGSNSIAIGAGPRSAWLSTITTERQPWVKYYEEKSQQIKNDLLPNLSLLRRLGPAFLLLTTTLYLSLYLSENYTPPPTSARLWPDTAPAVATLTTITALLTLTFLLSRFPPFWPVLNKYLTIVPALPQPLSILGYTLRHNTLAHLAVNTAVLWVFGLTLHQDVGRGTFLAILFASAATGGFTSLAAHVLRKQWNSYAFGVSAAALGVVMAACTLRPQGMLEVRGVGEVPFAAWILAVGLAGMDLVALRFGLRVGVDHWGHLGGMGMGVLAGGYVRWRYYRGDTGTDGEGGN